MKVVVTGASGLIGSALVPALRAGGHDVVRLVRRPARAADEVRWDPDAGHVDPLSGVDAAVHLAGAGVGDHRWTAAYKETIRASRVDGTRTLASALAALDPPPRVLVSGSAVGWYGDPGDQPVDESAPPGEDFLARVVVDWEAATAPAEAAGIRVVRARSGVVFSREGGALGRMLPLFRLGLGGRLGSGRQYWSVISIEDEVRALRFLLETDSVVGPVNLTAPAAATNAEVMAAIAAAVGRPALLPVPAFALRAGLGGFASEILASRRVTPRVLTESGFEFRHPDAHSVVRATV